MPVNVTMPQLGESVTEGTITRWLKAVGDTVNADEPLLEVSTDKVDTEIPAPASGVLLSIDADEDAVVEVGGLLGVIGEPDEASSAAAPAAHAAPTAAPPAETPPPAAPSEPSASAAGSSRSEDSTQTIRRPRLHLAAACLRALSTERYASWKPVYFPTSATEVVVVKPSIAWAMAPHVARSAAGPAPPVKRGKLSCACSSPTIP